MIRYFISALIATVLFGTSSCSQNSIPKNKQYSYEVIVSDIDMPWGFVFLPNGSMLITEKSGKLIHFENGTKKEINGLPTVEVLGQGGLLDVELHPNYNQNGWIYATYASPDGVGEGANTALIRFKLNGDQVAQVESLYKANPNNTKGNHFGSRIEFDNDGYLYFTIGDRGYRDINPQDVTKDGGKVYRLNDDGSIPSDNPFMNNANARTAIYSYGHRNQQGMVKHPSTGDLWAHEHGPKGGDEINIIKKGSNYGWPLASYGINYDGTSFTENTSLPNMVSPIHYWTPSIAPSGMTFVTSDVYPELKGNLLVGSLRFQYVNLCYIVGNKVKKEERLLDGIGRVRSMQQGPDGYVYLGVENLGIVKLIQKN